MCLYPSIYDLEYSILYHGLFFTEEREREREDIQCGLCTSMQYVCVYVHMYIVYVYNNYSIYFIASRRGYNAIEILVKPPVGV